MKMKLLTILILGAALFPVFSQGALSNDSVAEVPLETTAVSHESEPIAATGEDLFVKLNKAGFETPVQGDLPSIEFSLFNLEGIKKSLSDYKGKVVFLNFWATWCGPCRSEMPAMENVYKDLKDDGFVILAVDLNEDRNTVQAFVDDLGLTFPILLDQTGEVGGAYEARSIPTTYLIGRDGNILGRAIGVRPWEEDSYISLLQEILKM